MQIDEQLGMAASEKKMDHASLSPLKVIMANSNRHRVNLKHKRLASPPQDESVTEEKQQDEIIDDPWKLEEKKVRRLASSLANLASKGKRETRAFTGSSIPKISLDNYLLRMCGYLNKLQPQFVDGVSLGYRALVISMIFLDRMYTKHKNFELTEANVHRLTMTTVLLATKLTEDVAVPNSWWCQVGGVSLQELNKLEGQLCSLLEWNLHISEIEFFSTIRMF